MRNVLIAGAACVVGLALAAPALAESHGGGHGGGHAAGGHVMAGHAGFAGHGGMMRGSWQGHPMGGFAHRGGFRGFDHRDHFADRRFDENHFAQDRFDRDRFARDGFHGGFDRDRRRPHRFDGDDFGFGDFGGFGGPYVYGDEYAAGPYGDFYDGGYGPEAYGGDYDQGYSAAEGYGDGGNADAGYQGPPSGGGGYYDAAPPVDRRWQGEHGDSRWRHEGGDKGGYAVRECSCGVWVWRGDGGGYQWRPER